MTFQFTGTAPEPEKIQFNNAHDCTLQNGWSALLVACEQGHLEVAKILLDHHARVDVFDEVSEICSFVQSANNNYRRSSVVRYYNCRFK